MRKVLLSVFSLFFICQSVHSQGLYDLEHIPEIRITFEEANWEQLLDSMKASGIKERITATVTIDGKTFPGVGARYKGNSSYNNPKSKGVRKLPFNLKADYVDKDQTFPGGYETIKLSNVFQDASYVREVLSYEIARKYMPAPKCNFAKLYINDEYIGLYNNTQAVDDVLLESYFSSDKGTFFKCDPEYDIIRELESRKCPEGDKASLMFTGEDQECYHGWYELESKDNSGWNELIALVATLEKYPERIETMLNVDMTLWMHAFNNVLVNLDSYTGRLSHNYYLYKTPDGLFTPLVWDMNISLGGFRYDGLKQGALENEELQTYSMFSHYKTRNAKRPLITNLLVNDLYRKIYIGHCKTIVDENFANGEYLEFAKKVQTIIDAEVKADPNKLYSYEDFKKNLYKSTDIGMAEIIGVEELMKERTKYLTEHPLFNGTNPVFGEVKHQMDGFSLTFTANITGAIGAYVAVRNSDRDNFRYEKMYDDGTHGDTKANDGVWTLNLSGQPGMHYYFVAEGDRLAMTHPARNFFEYFTIK